ncbi:STAS domain-containing protein [Spirilliplanes yamanashiensis]|uniref:Anti-sigma factor antagonist n=1 Tax=Spirilliplanes yamanashiensis TaxID=42233 RepID=A0A8J3Y4Y3_9ACTN|nr:STAS domain-containing protein [Spirilliplanes yamanashiensis]MDP9819359.1 anti-anti-sigma factor [Spirilliplanes yamanashiensis]GIJ01818.1 hypothetical protein Sya03_11700 [Spirilliplanes yamanashiensis]
MTPDFSVEVTPGRVVVTGDVDMETAPRLRDALAGAAAGARPVVADLTATRFLDSAGVAALFAQVPGGLEIVAVPGSVITRVLEITGLTTAATVHGPD